MDLGIVVVSYNTCALLRRCLTTVYASRGLAFRLCVVDNASPDASAEMVTREFPQALLIANVENVGYPAANNQGLRALGFEQGQTDGPRYALLLNPDTEVQPTALAQTVAFMDEHPELGILGPKLVRPDGSLDLACRRSFPSPEISFYQLTGLARLFPQSRRLGRYNLTYLDPDQGAEVDAVVGAFMLVRRAAITAVGLLDESFFMYGEDLDWAYRIKAAGWKVYYYPAVTVLHVKRAASRQSAKAQIEFWRSMEIFYRKHYAAQTAWWVHGLIIGTLWVKLRFTTWRVRR
ncbi:MAG TPA: glycosyltransferase family 2 protein [Thermoflexia bacterium]|nr:glycosyltransferase family 2 protein [Thermoflexia bacterium]